MIIIMPSARRGAALLLVAGWVSRSAGVGTALLVTFVSALPLSQSHRSAHNGRMLFVMEVVPDPQDGGGMRARQVINQSATIFGLQPWLIARALYQFVMDDCKLDNLFQSLNVQVVTPGLEDVTILDTFKATTGSASELADFGAFAVCGGACDGGGVWPVAMLSFWSFHIAPSGDVHLTIPEMYIPQLRTHARETCIVVLADDIQHRRFRLEGNLSAPSVERLAERETAVYAAADGVFFVSREDRDEVEALLLRWRERQTSSARADELLPQMPFLEVLPFGGVQEQLPAPPKVSSALASPSPPEALPSPLLLFVGSPLRSNEAAVSWLVHEVMPVLRRTRPDLEITLVGRRTQQQEQYGRAQGVRTLGFVTDLEQLLAQASLLLLPSFIDSGVPTKIMIGIRHQIPVVTTSAGRRGTWHVGDDLPQSCDAANVPPLFVHDSAEEFAATTLRLLDDDKLRARARRCLGDFAQSLSVERRQQSALQAMRDHCSKVSDRRANDAGTRAVKRHQRRLTSDEAAADSLVKRLSRHVAWRGDSSHLRALDLTVMATFGMEDAEFVHGWLDGISEQRALHIYQVEVFVGCLQAEAYETMVAAVTDRLGALSDLFRVTVGLFATDPGIFGMWDAIIARRSTAPIVTIWNVDDRKHPESLRRRLGVLNSNATVGGVTAGVTRYKYDPRYTWTSDLDQAETSRLFELGSDRSKLQLKHLLKTEWRALGPINDYVYSLPQPYNLTNMMPECQLMAELTAELRKRWKPIVIGTQNVPHGSPMWRKDLHERLGGFRAKDGRDCYGFLFWFRVLSTGTVIAHINDPLEMYLARDSGHAHKVYDWNSRRWLWFDRPEWTDKCETSDEWEAHCNTVIDQVWHAQVLPAVRCVRLGGTVEVSTRESTPRCLSGSVEASTPESKPQWHPGVSGLLLMNAFDFSVVAVLVLLLVRWRWMRRWMVCWRFLDCWRRRQAPPA